MSLFRSPGVLRPHEGGLVRSSMAREVGQYADRFGLGTGSTGWADPNRAERNGFSVDNGRAGVCGSYGSQPTLVLDKKPDGKHGSEVTHRSVVTSASVRRSRCDRSARSPATCMSWPTGCRSVECEQPRWNPPACTGFRCTRSSRPEAFKYLLSMRSTSRMCLAERVTFPTASESSICIRSVCRRPAFDLPDEICVIRSLWRHRESLVHMAAEHTMHMQKALSQMNLQLHHVLSDITGLSGLAILCHHWWRTRSGQARQLVQWARQEPAREGREVFGGDYWPEHLFALRQSLVGLRFYRKLMAEVEVELQLRTREPKAMQVLLELAKYPARSFRKRKSLTALGRRFCM
jgi:hypothetical protein